MGNAPEEVIGTMAEFRREFEKAENTFMGCDCCGFIPVPREEILSSTKAIPEEDTVRWTSVSGVPKSIVFLVAGV